MHAATRVGVFSADDSRPRSKPAMIVACATDGCTTKVFASGFCVTCEAEQRAAKITQRPPALPIRLLLRPLKKRQPAATPR
jgi:hypothetical protein